MQDTLSLKVGETFVFGAYGGEPIVWRVLEVRDGKAFVLSEKALDAKSYNETVDYMSWEKCDLRSWLNGAFLAETFSDTERARIALARRENPKNQSRGTQAGNPTDDYVFCLSMDEMQRLFASMEDCICYPSDVAVQHGAKTGNGGACYWWLCTPGDNTFRAAYVAPIGCVASKGDSVNREDIAVRPALWVNL